MTTLADLSGPALVLVAPFVALAVGLLTVTMQGLALRHARRMSDLSVMRALVDDAFEQTRPIVESLRETRLQFKTERSWDSGPASRLREDLGEYVRTVRRLHWRFAVLIGDHTTTAMLDQAARTLYEIRGWADADVIPSYGEAGTSDKALWPTSFEAASGVVIGVLDVAFMAGCSTLVRAKRGREHRRRYLLLRRAR